MYFSKIIYFFLFIFLITTKICWAQEFMYFVKGADMKTVSFLEPGSSLGFSSEDVIINGEKLVKRGGVRYTAKYMIYPSTIKSSNGGMDIDVYWSLGSTNYNCIIDWGNNTLEQFKLIEVDIASYKKSESEIKKQNEIKKRKYLSDLPLKLENLEKELDKAADLNMKLGLIYSIVNDYNEYKILFQNDPPEIIKLKQLSNEISSQIENKKNELKSQNTKLDSLRIFNVRVVSFSNSDKSIDTFMVVKRAASLVFYTFFKDSTVHLNNYIDSNFISLFSKKIKSIKVLNSAYLDENNYLQICELNVPLSEFISLGQNLGWELPSISLSNATVFKVIKYEFFKNQEFNAMCDIIGNLHNSTFECFESKIQKSELSNVGNSWKAKYKIDVIFNEKINDLRKTLLTSCSYFTLNNLDLNDTYKSDVNIEKFSIYITPEIGEEYNMVSTNGGNFIQYVFTSSMTFNLIQDYFKKLNNFYYKQWSMSMLNNNYYGTNLDDKWFHDHFSFSTEYKANSIYINFPQKSQIISSYSINLDLKESEIEKYTDSLKLVFNNIVPYNYKAGGFQATLYTYGVEFVYEGVNRYQQGTQGRVFYDTIIKYSAPSSDLTPPQLLPFIKKGDRARISYAGQNLETLQYFNLCNVLNDTLTRGFWFPTGGGKNGKKSLTIYAKPTKVKVVYSFYPLFFSNQGNENSNVMISYLTDWQTYYPPGNYVFKSINLKIDEIKLHNNYTIYKTNPPKTPASGYKILKIENE